MTNIETAPVTDANATTEAPASTPTMVRANWFEVSPEGVLITGVEYALICKDGKEIPSAVCGNRNMAYAMIVSRDLQYVANEDCRIMRAYLKETAKPGRYIVVFDQSEKDAPEVPNSAYVKFTVRAPKGFQPFTIIAGNPQVKLSGKIYGEDQADWRVKGDDFLLQMRSGDKLLVYLKPNQAPFLLCMQDGICYLGSEEELAEVLAKLVSADLERFLPEVAVGLARVNGVYKGDMNDEGKPLDFDGKRHARNNRAYFYNRLLDFVEQSVACAKKVGELLALHLKDLNYPVRERIISVYEKADPTAKLLGLVRHQSAKIAERAAKRAGEGDWVENGSITDDKKVVPNTDLVKNREKRQARIERDRAYRASILAMPRTGKTEMQSRGQGKK